MKRTKFFWIYIIMNLPVVAGWAHPTGNMVQLGKHIFWSYVSPVGEIEHHASIMIWDQESDPRLFLQSEHPSSDFMLHVRENSLFIIERRNDEDSSFIRILRADTDGNLQTIHPWFRDTHRIGEAGFLVLNNGSILFARYPDIFLLDQDRKISPWKSFSSPVHRIRQVEFNKILIQFESSCQLTDMEGQVIHTWNNLLREEIQDAPLNRNMIFDADYSDGRLLLAYWGGREFVLYEGANEDVIYKPGESLVPHWVLILDDGHLLFSSNMDFQNPFTRDGERTTVTPWLVLYKKNTAQPIWTINPESLE